MARPSIALFLATAGLLAGAAGCAKAPEAGPSSSPTPTTQAPAPAGTPAVPYHNQGDEGGEGGEG